MTIEKPAAKGFTAIQYQGHLPKKEFQYECEFFSKGIAQNKVTLPVFETRKECENALKKFMIQMYKEGCFDCQNGDQMCFAIVEVHDHLVFSVNLNWR